MEANDCKDRHAGQEEINHLFGVAARLDGLENGSHGLSHRTKADEADRIGCVHHRAAPLLSARTML